MHFSGVTAPSTNLRKTSRGTRTTPSYSPIPTPNSMAWASPFQRASSGKVKNMAALPLIQAPVFLYCSLGRQWQEYDGEPICAPGGGKTEMCGRVVQKTPMSEIRVLFETVNPVPNAAPTYNGAPTDTLPVVRLDRAGRRSLHLLP